MPKLSVLKLISDATIAYQEMQGTFKYFLHVLKKQNKIDDKTANDVLSKLDYLTQGILIHVALADGVFHENEKLFIEEITHYTDIMAYLSDDTGFEFKWDDFIYADDESRKSLLDAVDGVVNDLCSTCLCSMAMASALTEGEFFNVFITELTSILSSFVNIDGEFAMDENMVIKATIDSLILNPYKVFVEQVNK